MLRSQHFEKSFHNLKYADKKVLCLSICTLIFCLDLQYFSAIFHLILKKRDLLYEIFSLATPNIIFEIFLFKNVLNKEILPKC